MSDWKFGSTLTDWIFGSTNFVVSEDAFAIVDPPTTIARGETFTLQCVGVTEEPSAATLDDQPLVIESHSVDAIELTAAMNILAEHGTGKTVAITVDGVTQQLSVSFVADAGRSVVTLINPEGGAGTVYEGMVDLETNEPMVPETGGQVIYSVLSTPNLEDVSYEVVFREDGWPEMDVEGATLDGTESFTAQYLLPGVAISNVMVLTARNYLSSNSNPTLSTSIPNATIQQGDSLSVNVSSSFSDANGDLLVFSKVSGPATVSVSSAGLVTGTINEVGTFSVVIQADDERGGTPATGVLTITVTKIPVTTPNPITFDSVTGANPGQTVSSIKFITGPDAGAELTTDSFELSNDGVSWSTTVTMVPGQTRVKATATASSTFGAEESVTGEVNGVEATFTVVTRAAVTTPTSFGWAPVFNAEVETEIESTTRVLMGTEAPASISIVNGEYRYDDGEGFTAYTDEPGTVPPGATFQVRHTSAAEEDAQVVTRLTIGGYTANFVSYTGAAGGGESGFGSGIQRLITRLIA